MSSETPSLDGDLRTTPGTAPMGEPTPECPACGREQAEVRRGQFACLSLRCPTVIAGFAEGTFFTDAHQDAIGLACEKLWNSDPIENPIGQPRHPEHPLHRAGMAAHDAGNAAAALQVAHYKALARLTVLEQENAELREDRDLLRVQVGHAISRLSECALPRQVEHAKFGVYSGSDAGEAFDELRKRARITFTDNGFTLDADARSA